MMHTDPNENQSARPLAWSPVTEAMRHDHDPLRTRRGNPIDPADPGSPFSRFMTLVLALLLATTVIVWQNSGEELKLKHLLHKVMPPVELEPDEPAPGSYDRIDLIGRVYIRGYELLKSQSILEQFEKEDAPMIVEDRVRIIMLAGEFEGDEAALTRIATLREELAQKQIERRNRREDERASGEATDPAQDRAGEPADDSADGSADDLIVIEKNDDLIIAELSALETIYTQGIGELEDNQRQQLRDRYGLIGKAAATHGLAATDPLRQPLVHGIIPLGIFVILAGIVAIVGPLVGLGLLIVAIIRFASGAMVMRNHVPQRGGSVFLETYTLFIGAFLVMSIGTFFVSYSTHPELAGFSLLVQWVLLLTVLWGMVRGMPPGAWRRAIGWHAGEGVLTEIGCGIIGYLASLPLYIVGAVITAILLYASESLKIAQNNGVPLDPEPVSNPFFEMLASGDLFTILLLFVLATTWAPIVEEAIFRGALFRHLRGRMHWSLAALGTALLFAFMHDYGPLMVAPLIALGFTFAFMREWRGSLIASMTAHFLHNFTLVSFMIIFVQLIKDPM